MKQPSISSVSMEFQPSGSGYTQTFMSEDGKMLLCRAPRGVLARPLLEQGIPL